MDENRTKPTPAEDTGEETVAPDAAPPGEPGGSAAADPAGTSPGCAGGDAAPAGEPGPLPDLEFAEDAEPADLPPGEEDAAAAEAAPAGPDLVRAMSVVESILLVSAQPLSYEKIGSIAGGLSRADVREVVDLLRRKYPPESSGILVEEVAKGLQFRTNPANQEHVRKLFDAKPPRFSRAALETLAIVAYRQPVTRLEMEQIRGVDCAGSLKTLMERRLVRVMGKKDVPGKPFLFGTTREFLEVFGMGSLSDLPSMRDIEDFLSTARGEIVPDAPAAGEEWPAADAGPGQTAEPTEFVEAEPPAAADGGSPAGEIADVPRHPPDAGGDNEDPDGG